MTEILKSEETLIEKNLQLHNLASHLQDIREEERSTMAREIHDELGQQLTGLKMDIAWLQRKLKTENEPVLQKLKSSLELADVTINTVRRISSELHPSILDDLGLAEAIDWYGKEFYKRTGIRVLFQSNLHSPIQPKASIAFYRIFQEALTNVARHAEATQVESLLLKVDDQLILSITDNGKGFNISDNKGKKSLGLLSMKERVTMLNGWHELESQPGQGTKIRVKVPIPE